MTNSTSSDPKRLAEVPDQFRRLLARPLRPLTAARLPETEAVYLFYYDDEPIHVGSPPHLDERQMLAPSVRLSLAARIRANPDGTIKVSLASSEPRKDGLSVAARWLPVEDDQDRMMLEFYAAYKLGLSVSRPQA